MFVVRITAGRWEGHTVAMYTTAEDASKRGTIERAWTPLTLAGPNGPYSFQRRRFSDYHPGIAPRYDRLISYPDGMIRQYAHTNWRRTRANRKRTRKG